MSQRNSATTSALILDDGRTPVGVESTVLDLTGETPALLRPGGVTLEALSALLGPVAMPAAAAVAVARHAGEPLRAGVAAAPRRDCGAPRRGFARLRPQPPPGFAEVAWLSRFGDLGEAAANLFAMLRQLDRPAFSGIAVMPIPEHDLGRAINDRLRRAAAPRPS